MSLQQTISSATPAALTGFVAPAPRIYISNTDAALIVDVYLNGEASPSATLAAGVTMPFERLNTGITAVKLAAPSGSPVVCWGYQLR